MPQRQVSRLERLSELEHLGAAVGVHQTDRLGAHLGPDVVCDVGAVLGQEVRLPLARHPGNVGLSLDQVPLLPHPGYRPRDVRAGYGHGVGDSHLGQSERDLDLVGVVDVITQVQEDSLLNPWPGHGYGGHAPRA